MKNVVVLINGIDDVARHDDEALAKADSIRSEIISELCPAAGVKVFDFFPADTRSSDINENNILDQAHNIILQLKQFNEAPVEYSENPDDYLGIVFLAHSTGAVLVKKILLLAFQQPSIQWLAVGTIAVHFVDSPVYYEQYQWQRYLGSLLVDESLSLESLHLPGIFNALPIAFSRVELEFSIISAAFELHYHNTQRSASHQVRIVPQESATLRRAQASLLTKCQNEEKTVRNLWDFHDEYPDYLDILYSLQNQIQGLWNHHFKGRCNSFALLQQYISTNESILGWLSPAQPIPKILKKWLDDEGSTVQSWIRSPDSEVLLITGPRGSSDKHLSRCIVSTLLNIPRGEPEDSLILSFGFHYCDTRLNSERSLLSSLIQQIIILQPDNWRATFVIVHSLYNSGIPEFPISAMWGLLRNLLQSGQAQEIFLILHGVDQCLQPVATRIAELPATWKGLIPTRLKILMTSSACPELPTNIKTRKIDLGNDDWRKVASWMADERISKIVHRAPAWVDARQAILEQSYGDTHTHLQAMLNLDILERSNIPATKEAIEIWLSRPIRSLDDTFQVVASEICDIVSAKNIISWIVYAVRPLNIQELAVAVALSSVFPDGGGFESVTLESFGSKISSNLINDIEGALETMIKIDGDQVMLVHPTLREYLEKQRSLLQPDFHASITRWCLLYLSICCQTNSEDDSAIPAFDRATAFLDYSQRYWTHHYRHAHLPSESLDRQVLSFLASDEQSRMFQVWVTKYGINPGKNREKDVKLTGDPLLLAINPGKNREKDVKLTGDPLLLAIHLGLTRIAQMIVGTEDLKLQNERLGRVLVAAARSLDSEHMADLLALAPPDVDLGFAVCEAAAYGNTECVELLCNRMGESWIDFINPASGETERHPLLLAASGGHTSTVELLISKGCSLLTAGPHGYTPVHIACRLGDSNTLLSMKRLRQEDFTKARRLTVTVPKSLNAFGVACRIGSLAVFDLMLIDEDEPLLEVVGSSNRMNEVSPTYETMYWAVVSGNLALVKRLFLVSKDLLSYAFWPPPVVLVFPLAITRHLKIFQLLVEEQLKAIQIQTATDSPTESGFLDNMQYVCRCIYSFPLRLWRKEIPIYICEAVETTPLAECYKQSALHSGNVQFLQYYLSRENPTGYDLGSLDGLKVLLDDIASVLQGGDWCGCLRYLLKSLKKDEDAVRQHLADIMHRLIDLFLKAVNRARKFCLRELFRELFLSFHMAGAWVTILESAVTVGSLASLKEVLNWRGEGFKSSTPLAEKMFRLAITRKREDDDADRPERVKLLLSGGVLASSGGKGGMPPLHVAVEEKVIDVVKLLLEEGASPNDLKQPRQTSLHIAAQDGGVEILALLLLHGGDPNRIDWEGQTVLHIAIQRKSADMVRLLLGPWMEDEHHHGEDFAKIRRNSAKGRRAARPTKELPDTKRLIAPHVDTVIADHREVTPLILAAERGLIDIMRMLLLAGADPNFQDADGRTALYTIIDQRIEGVYGIQELLAFGADPNIYGGEFHSPLQCAIDQQGDDDIGNPDNLEIRLQKVKLLLDNGADPNAQGGMYGLPLNAAIWSQSVEMVEVLIDGGASANIVTPPFGCPLHNLARSPVFAAPPGFDETEDIYKMAELLLKSGADVDARNAYGSTPLMVLFNEPSISPDDHLFTRFLQKSRSPNIKDHLGTTALHYAILNHLTLRAGSFVEDLLKAGANPLARDNLGHTPLYYMLYRFWLDILEPTFFRDFFEEGWVPRFDAILEATPVEERSRVLSEAVIAAIKSGLERPLERVLTEHERGTSLDLSLVDGSGYTALDIAQLYVGNRDPEIISATTVQKLRALGALTTPESSRKTPTRLNKNDRHPRLLISEDEMEVVCEGSNHPFASQTPLVAAVRANHPIPRTNELFYFEVDVITLPIPDGSRTLAIGFQTEQAPLNELIGWSRASWGLQSDEGALIVHDFHAKRKDFLGNSYGEGSTVGVLVDMLEQRARFRVDDEWASSGWVDQVIGQLYPAVSCAVMLDCEVRMRVNFGPGVNGEGRPFKYAPPTRDRMNSYDAKGW